MKVLVTRTDRLGDLVLSLPAIAALKETAPDWEIHAMVAPAAVPLVRNDPHLDRVWTWRDDLPRAAARQLGNDLRAAGFDAAVMLQYRRQLAALLKRAGVGRLYGPHSKVSSWYYLNRGQRQIRSEGGRHEVDFNRELVARLLAESGLEPAGATAPRIRLDETQEGQRQAFRAASGAAAATVFIHPGSGGSALDWPPRRFAALANELAADGNCRVLVTGTEADRPVIEAVRRDLDPAVTVLLDHYELPEFLAVLAAGDLMIGPSTGPLHLAAAVGVATLGLFPPVASMHPDRWGPRGRAADQSRNLMPDVVCPAGRVCRRKRCPHFNCMDLIEVGAVLAAARGILAPKADLASGHTED